MLKNVIFKQIDDEVIINWKNNKKQVSNIIDTIINNFIQTNCLCFFITINKDKFHNNLNDNIEENIKFMEKTLWMEKYQSEFTLILPELNKNGLDHYHIIFVMRVLTNVNTQIKLNLINHLRSEISTDTVVEQLYDFTKIKERFNYILKDTYIHGTLDDDDKHRQNNLGYFKILVSNDGCSYLLHLQNLVNQINLINAIEYRTLYIHNWGSVSNAYDESPNRKTILLFIQYFIQINRLIIKNGHVYAKIEGTLVSYKKLGDLHWFSKNIKTIYSNLIYIYPINYYGIDINSIKLETSFGKDVINTHIDNLDELVFDFSIIEFKDGIYFMKEDKFIDKRYIQKQLNLYTIKYYDKFYSYERQKKPKYWIEAIQYVTNYKEGDPKFIEFCSRIANLVIKNQEIARKQKVLYIWGGSSTGKTSFVAKPLWKYFKEENVGIVSGNANFAYDYVVGKELVIWDEAVVEKKRREEVIKWWENQPIVANQKYKEQTILTEIQKVAISNYSLEPEENKRLKHKTYTDEALFNRVYQVKFEPVYNEKESHDRKMGALMIRIDEEDPHIIIYCNKQLTKKYGKTRTWYSKLLEKKQLENSSRADDFIRQRQFKLPKDSKE